MSHQETSKRSGGDRFRAMAGAAQGFGETPQDALTALMPHLPSDAALPIMILPYNQGDAFWSQALEDRLQYLKNRQGGLIEGEKAELEQLVAASFDATVSRTVPLVNS